MGAVSIPSRRSSRSSRGPNPWPTLAVMVCGTAIAVAIAWWAGNHTPSHQGTVNQFDEAIATSSSRPGASANSTTSPPSIGNGLASSKAGAGGAAAVSSTAPAASTARPTAPSATTTASAGLETSAWCETLFAEQNVNTNPLYLVALAHCQADRSTTLSTTQHSVARCLYINGVIAPVAYADATDASASGTLLDACRANPTYQAPSAAFAAPPAPTAPVASGNMPALSTQSAPTTVQRCFTPYRSVLCGQMATDRLGALPSTNNLQVMRACSSRTLYSPIGCALANGQIPLRTPRGDAPAGDYWAWDAAGDVFVCPLSGPPTEGACTFEFRTTGDSWGMATYLSTPPTGCPPPLQGVETGERVAVTLGLGTSTGYRSESAMIDTGAPMSWALVSQLQGTAWHPVGGLSSILFPLVAPSPVKVQEWQGPLGVQDGSQWVSLGSVEVEGLEQNPGVGVQGFGLGLNALGGVSLDVHGSTWTMYFECGG